MRVSSGKRFPDVRLTAADPAFNQTGRAKLTALVNRAASSAALENRRIEEQDLQQAFDEGGGADRPLIKPVDWDDLILPAPVERDLRNLIRLMDAREAERLKVPVPTGPRWLSWWELERLIHFRRFHLRGDAGTGAERLVVAARHGAACDHPHPPLEARLRRKGCVKRRPGDPGDSVPSGPRRRNGLLSALTG